VLFQPVHHVTKELVVTALVGTDGDAISIFLDGGTHDVINASVMAEVDNFGALRLYQAAHDVDCRIVAIEQRGSGDEAQRCLDFRYGGTWQIGGCSTHRSGISEQNLTGTPARKARIP
jgi:hypothetical protein